MNITAHADIDVVAVEQPDSVSVLLELSAPEGATDQDAKPRPPATVQVVLDRSGSMAGGSLGAAKEALARLVDRLDPADRLGVVAFDDAVSVPLPAAPLTDKPAAKRAIAAIHPGGMTNLSGGLLRGLQEAGRAKGETGATLLLLSDGHANQGEVDPVRLGAVAAKAAADGITVATIGIGLGYDETLLAEIARGGRGDHLFAEHDDAAAGAVAAQVEGLLEKTVQCASLLVRPAEPVQTVRIWNDLPSTGLDEGIMVELGDLWAGEERSLVLSFEVPAAAALGLAEVATLELRYVALPGLVEETVSIQVHVNVVPGDQAAGRIPDPKVRSELIYQQAQDAKRRGADALGRGDAAEADRAYRSTDALLAAGMAACPPGPRRAELATERDILAELAGQASAGEADLSAKRARSEHARKSRKRGRGDGSR